MTLLELLTLLRKHLRLVVVLPVACAIAVAAYAFLFMENTYSTTTSMYVLTLDQTATGANLYSDLNASQQVANDIAQLMDSSRVRDDAARAVGLEDLDGFEISVASETNTRVITLTVTGSEPRAVAEVANALAESVGDVAREVMNVESVNVIDEASAPTAPSGPNRPLYIAVGLMAGLFAAVAIVVLMDMLDTRVRGDEIVELLGVPVIGRIPLVKGGN